MTTQQRTEKILPHTEQNISASELRHSTGAGRAAGSVVNCSAGWCSFCTLGTCPSRPVRPPPPAAFVESQPPEDCPSVISWAVESAHGTLAPTSLPVFTSAHSPIGLALLGPLLSVECERLAICHAAAHIPASFFHASPPVLMAFVAPSDGAAWAPGCLGLNRIYLCFF